MVNYENGRGIVSDEMLFLIILYYLYIQLNMIICSKVIFFSNLCYLFIYNFASCFLFGYLCFSDLLFTSKVNYVFIYVSLFVYLMQYLIRSNV